MSLGVPNGELLCLLGPNGGIRLITMSLAISVLIYYVLYVAGKTTTIKMLTGIHSATGGDAYICGKSIRDANGMREIRKILGFCPQHDILWPELSAREHLRLFAGFKNIPESLVEYEIACRLEEVQLTAWSDAPSMSYSGGMKRRLSVALALIGTSIT